VLKLAYFNAPIFVYNLDFCQIKGALENQKKVPKIVSELVMVYPEVLPNALLGLCKMQLLFVLQNILLTKHSFIIYSQLVDLVPEA